MKNLKPLWVEDSEVITIEQGYFRDMTFSALIQITRKTSLLTNVVSELISSDFS